MGVQHGNFEIEEKTIEPMLVAGVRMTGRYDQCGQGFSRIARAMGRHICGNPKKYLTEIQVLIEQDEP